MTPLVFLTKLDLGGMERVCTTLCNEWTAQGRAFLLYVSYDGGGMRKVVQAEECVVVANKPARRAAIELMRLCRLHPNSPALVFSFEICVVLVLLKTFGLIRNRIVLRESTAIMSHCSCFWRWMYSMVGPHIDGIIAQSQKGRADLSLLFHTRQPTTVIYNPCAFATCRPPLAFERRNGARLHLLIVGRLAAMKGHVRLLKAISTDGKRDGNDWRLTIVGDGSCRTVINNTIKEIGIGEHVVMLGTVLDVRPVYESADIFVIASDYEGLPNTLIEAIACGCRVVVIDGDGGTAEFMQSIGLAAFVFSREEFDCSFWECVEKVLRSDSVVWYAAYEALVEKIAPERVANQVWDFLCAVGR